MFVLGMNQMSFLNERMDKKTFSENNNQRMALALPIFWLELNRVFMVIVIICMFKNYIITKVGLTSFYHWYKNHSI